MHIITKNTINHNTTTITISKNVDTTNLIQQSVPFSVVLYNIHEKFKISAQTHFSCYIDCHSDSVLNTNLITNMFKKYIPDGSFITNLEEDEVTNFKPEVFIVDDPYDVVSLVENFKDLILNVILSEVNLQELDFIWSKIYFSLDINTYDEN